MNILNKFLLFSIFTIFFGMNATIAKPSSIAKKVATVYIKPFYPSEYTPEMMVYARDIKTGKTYPFKIAQDARQQKITLPAPATYIFFSWTTDKIGYDDDMNHIKIGAVLSECDGSSQEICKGKDKHMPKPMTLNSGQVIKDLQIANYYYPSNQTYLYVPTP